jgi:hypothetical protein
MIRKAFLLSIFIFIIKVTQVQAQYGVTIYNNSYVNVQFKLSYDNFNWSAPYYLNSMAGQIYPMQHPSCSITIPTFDNNGNYLYAVTYPIYSPNRYQIYWNTYYRRWDLMLY